MAQVGNKEVNSIPNLPPYSAPGRYFIDFNGFSQISAACACMAAVFD